MIHKLTLPALLLSALLSACVNDGTVADRHAITFERPLPAQHPSSAQVSNAFDTWLARNFYDAASIKDKSFGPVRYAALLIPASVKDFFVCARFTAKNKYGTYTPPQSYLLLLRDHGRGLSASLAKEPGTGQYDQYCAGQTHG